MILLRKICIISAIIITIVFFVTAEVFKEHIEEDAEKPNIENPFLPYAGLFLFGAPISVAGIIASFFKTTKSKIIVFCGITVATVVVIFIIAFLMLEYPTFFGIPETYWEIEK